MVLIIFPVILQTVINFKMLSIGRQRGASTWWSSRRHSSWGPRREKPPIHWQCLTLLLLLLKPLLLVTVLVVLLMVVVVVFCWSWTSYDAEELTTHFSLAPWHLAFSPHFTHSGPATGTYGASVGPTQAATAVVQLSLAIPSWLGTLNTINHRC